MDETRDNALARLHAAVSNMAEGLCMFDADRRLVISNDHYAAIYDLPPDLVRPGTLHRDIVAYRTSHGMEPLRKGETFLNRHEVLLTEMKAAVEVVQLGNGRIIMIRHQPLEIGGWVATHLDITEQRSREAELNEQNARFDAAINNMPLGLCMFNAAGRLIVSNRLYAEMYHIPANLITPGLSLEDVLELRLEYGNQPVGGGDAYRRRRMDQFEDQDAQADIVEFIDGGVISILHHPMPGGGKVSTHQDITEQRRIEAHIQHMAGHDPLTDLPNRSLFQTQLEQVSAKVDRGDTAAVLCIDLDGFKGVNDALGHSAGDALLKEVAGRLAEMTRETDVVARLGGDEFAILANGLDQAEDAAVLAARIVEVMAQPFYVEGHHVVIGASVGIAVAPVDGRDGATLVKHADLALYRAKAGGRGTYHFYEKGLDAALQERRAIETALRGALVRDEFRLVFQPLINLKENRICSFEALLRWQHPERGYLEPAQFIPVAEESGLIVPIGEWVLQQACAAAVAWPEGTSVAVNLSPVQFRKNRHVVDHVKAALANSGLRPDRLELEITESVLLADSPLALDTLRQLKEVGVKIAMDDFGTGYSSLSYLRRFPFDKIKIDQSFVRDSSASQDSLAIVKAVIGLGRSLGMTTTAEGVETEAQLDMIREQGCTEVQGFLLSAPLPAGAVTELLSRTGSAKADGTMRARDVA